MNKHAIKRIVIAGGGTAGWIAAACFAKLIGKHLDITLVESDDIGTVGVGEATIPPLLTLHKLLQIKEQDFMAATNATFKLGIAFEHWRNLDQHYIHSFGTTGKDCWAAGFQHFWLKAEQLGIADDFGQYCPELVAAQQNKFAVMGNQAINYAYHLDASLYARFLRNIAQSHGAKRIEGKISQVQTCEHSGNITALKLADGQLIEGDLFIDCTGFRALLIEQTLHTGYDDWTHWLPCDSAWAVQTSSVQPAIPYTRSIAHPWGWQWQIPLQNRVGNGMVYCSRYVADDEAKQALLNSVQGDCLTEPRLIKFKTGQRRKHWHKNCVAMGLSSGFIEPLESTSIHLIQRSIVRLLQLLPYASVEQCDIDEFNRQTEHEVNNIRDFIILHYHVTNRTDSKFWQHCRQMAVPDSLRHRIELFKRTGRVFKVPDELFAENSWIQVMMGQGLTPQQYHPIVDMMSEQELRDFLAHIKSNVSRFVAQLPPHHNFIRHYCPAAKAQ
ncbi:tryptophan 7-halogenase [Bowmanella denitrificans]|uniref:Tryptophan 7-halogenase n=1 Tax=Bowmanella denitrificans TaxID=366582 RepID=A0ABP3GAT1_9ALTE